MSGYVLPSKHSIHTKYCLQENSSRIFFPVQYLCFFEWEKGAKRLVIMNIPEIEILLGHLSEELGGAAIAMVEVGGHTV